MQRVRIDRANTVLYCDDWGPTVAFYRDTLGFDVVHETDWFVELQLTPDAFLSVADASRTSIEAVGGRGITLTLHTDDLLDAKAVLEEQGISTTPVTRRWGADVFYCHDPEGHRIEFWSDAPPSG